MLFVYDAARVYDYCLFFDALMINVRYRPDDDHDADGYAVIQRA